NEAIRANAALRTENLSEEDRRRNQLQLMESLTKAFAEFENVEDALLKRTALESPDSDMLRQAGFAAAECQFYLGRYEEALKRYLALADRYKNQVEGLIALSQVWQCYRYLKQPRMATGVLDRLKETFEKLPESAFDGTTPGKKRAYWSDWLIQAGKQN